MKVICINIDDNLLNSDYTLLHNYLTEEQKKRVDRFRYRIDSIRTMVGELVVKLKIYEDFGIHPKEVSFARNNFNKPFLKGFNNFHFNISHSGSWVAIAFHNQEVGIDIEETKTIEYEMINSVFSEKEKTNFNSTPKQEQLSFFYDLWVLKESYIKAIGKGLYEELTNISMVKAQGIYKCYKKNKEQSQKFHLQNLSSNYKLAICSTDFDDSKVEKLLIQNLVNKYSGIRDNFTTTLN